MGQAWRGCCLDRSTQQRNTFSCVHMTSIRHVTRQCAGRQSLPCPFVSWANALPGTTAASPGSRSRC